VVLVKRSVLRVALLAVLVSAAGATLAVRSVGDAPTGRGTQAYLEMLDACSDGAQPSSKEEALAVRTCMWEVADTAYQEGGIGDFADVLEPAISADPWLRMSCHPAAHMLTEERSFDREALELLLEEVGDVSTCDWAFGHAAVSGLGLLGPAEYRRGEILSWCLANDADPIIYRNCVDGVGHHVWLATASLEESVLACEEVPADVRMSCGGGVLMQMFEPATQNPAEYGRDEAEKVIPGFCDEWRRYAKEQRTVETCAHGAGYVYGLDLRDAVFAELRVLLPGAQGLSPEASDRLGQAVGLGARRCAELGDDLATTCMLMLSRSIPVELMRVDVEVYASLCGLLPEESVSKACRERKY
jgi:hypothetical protein